MVLENITKYGFLAITLLTHAKLHITIPPVLSPCGGIGRRARFRFWWETVQVQVLSGAEIKRLEKIDGLPLKVAHLLYF